LPVMLRTSTRAGRGASSVPPIFLRMTPEEIRIAAALSRCTLGARANAKAFVRQIRMRDPEKLLNERERACLWAVAWSCRR